MLRLRACAHKRAGRLQTRTLKPGITTRRVHHQACSWEELPVDVLHLLFSAMDQHERMQQTAMVCRNWNNAACSMCHSVIAGCKDALTSRTWPALCSAYYTRQWLQKHGCDVFVLQLHGFRKADSGCLEIGLPLAFMPKLQALTLKQVAVPASSWAECTSSNSDCRTLVPASLRELTLSDCSRSVPGLAAARLSGLEKLILDSCKVKAADLTAALAHSSSRLTELKLQSCMIQLTVSNTASPQGSSPAAGGDLAAATAAGDVAVVQDIYSVLADLANLMVLEVSYSKQESPAGTESPLSKSLSQMAGNPFKKKRVMQKILRNRPPASMTLDPVLQLKRLTLCCNGLSIGDMALLDMASPDTLTHLNLKPRALMIPKEGKYDWRAIGTDWITKLQTLPNLRHCELGSGCTVGTYPAAAFSQLGLLQRLTHLDLAVCRPFVARDVGLALFTAKGALPALQTFRISGAWSQRQANMFAAMGEEELLQHLLPIHVECEMGTWELTAQGEEFIKEQVRRLPKR